MRSLFISSAAAFLAVFAGKAAELSSSELKTAQKMYVVKCSKCHEIYDPTKYTDEEWSAWMVKMKRKSKLKDDQFELLRRYTEILRAPAKTSAR